MTTNYTANVTKDSRVWHTEEIVTYPGWNPTYTYRGAARLASAIRDIANFIVLVSRDEPVTFSLTVKGKVMTGVEAYQILYNDLHGTALMYRLPEYRKVLAGC